VIVFLDVAGSESFSQEQKRRILRRLATRADKDGVIRVVSQKHRTQKANRAAAVERLRELLKESLKKKTLRKKTLVPEKARRKRLEEKKRRSMLKQQRTRRAFIEDSDE
jgi:ribosome-associated protein